MSEGQRSKNIVNEADVEWIEKSHSDRSAWKRKPLAAEAGRVELGCSMYELAPGKRAFPYHCHLANEEAIFVLSGSGILRLGDGEHPVREGDYIALPAGQDHAHMLTNDGGAPLRFLCMSTMKQPDVVRYPDSNKIGILAGSAPGGDLSKRSIHAFFPAEADVDYWHGEE